jgi:hypothetical protein
MAHRPQTKATPPSPPGPAPEVAPDTAPEPPPIALVEDATDTLLAWAALMENSCETYLQRSQRLAARLGARHRPDGLTEVGFWTPELAAEVIPSERDIFLEIFTPLDPVNFAAPEQTVTFRRDRVPLRHRGEFVWGVLSGMIPGDRDRLGSLYWLRFVDLDGNAHVIRDILSHSRPYGVFGPPELYDIDHLQLQRRDRPYFNATGIPAHLEAGLLASALDDPNLIPRLNPPSAILQLHVPTATPDGSLAGLTRLYQTISDKLDRGEPLTPAETCYVGYDAIQLLPVEPTIEYRREDDNRPHEPFSLPEDFAEPDWSNLDWSPQTLAITLRKAHTQNWGYDVPIVGAAATNPSLLETLRPDEVVDFIATLHNFSTGPIQLIYDLVYGHADNQALELINRQFLKGPNMYGQDLNHQLPMVRAILLEMQRRKIDTGADGIRVDGGQDFRFFNPLSGRIEQDDAYLLAMADVVQTVGDRQRRLFVIYEDGRPWPAEGWEETSTYRDLVDLMPEAYQWGPLIFAHNTPALKGFWDRKWERVCQVMFGGDRWITGCGNHDTLRRGNQIPVARLALGDDDLDSPEDLVNWNLGQTLPEVFKNAYDNPATKLWVYGFSPGLPMDFLQGNLRAPWGFFRNTDDRYGVKVAAEEMGFLDWQVWPERYGQPDVFLRLKALGFDDLVTLKQFGHALALAMVETDYDLGAVVEICRACWGEGGDRVCPIPALGALKELKDQAKSPAIAPGETGEASGGLASFMAALDVPLLKHFAMAFMEDGHDYCNAGHWTAAVEESWASFGWRLRQFRAAHPWLRENLGGRDRFNRISDGERTVFYGLRSHPDDRDIQLALAVHMGGAPITVTLGDWLQLDLDEWRIAIATPGLLDGNGNGNRNGEGEGEGAIADLRHLSLADSQGILLQRIP